MSSSEEESEYEVEKILDKKGSGSTLKYRIKWKGYPKPTWEPASNCDCKEMIIAFEREHAKSSKQKSGAESDSEDETPEIPASSSGSSKKRRVGTPKTTFNRSRASIRTPATPFGNQSKKAAKAATSSDSSSQQLTPPRKRTRTSAPVKKSPSKSPRKNLPQSPRSLTPLSQCDDLNFNIERIESLADLNGRKGLIIKTTEGRTKTVDVKAAAKQNCDMVLNFLIERLP
jgi:hypothetical protein